MAHQELKAPFLTSFVALIWMTCLFLLGKVRDVMDVNMWFYGRKIHRKGYAPIRDMTDEFYRRRMYGRIQDLWNRPICSAPGAWIKVMDRKALVNSDHPAPGVLVPTGSSRLALNLGSYNYLGFAAADEYCTPRVLRTLQTHGVSACAPRAGAGTTDVHLAMEAQLRRFLGVDDVMTYGMGFATNSATIPVLVGKGCLILSDALNHASIVAGAKISGAKVKVFRHNDAGHLEALLRQSIAYGQPRTHRPWKKILVIIEGIYSMEGETCRCLADIVAIKKRYGAYLYLDEAHSIGAMGRSGRGVCEHYGVDPRDIDIMMGTFTKSFGSCGGYVGGSREVVDYVRRHSPAHLHATAMAPGAVQQVLSALKLLMNEDELPGGGVGSGRGPAKVARLHDNANYFRQRLINMRLDVLGDWDSPVMPVMIYHPGKLNVFSKMLLERHLAVVMVGFPATPVMLVRTRVCISAAHSREDLDYALEAIQQISDLIGLRYCTTKVTPPGHKQRSLSNPGNLLLPTDGSAFLTAQQQQNGKAANGNGNGVHANGVKQQHKGTPAGKGTPGGKRQQQQQAASPAGANGGFRGKASDVVHA